MKKQLFFLLLFTTVSINGWAQSINFTYVPLTTRVGSDLTVWYKYSATVNSNITCSINLFDGSNWVSNVNYETISFAAGTTDTRSFKITIPNGNTPTIGLTGNFKYKIHIEIKNTSGVWLAGDYPTRELNLVDFLTDANGFIALWPKESTGVGIGTGTTGIHKLAVEGSIGAREIKVENGPWSDFVFFKNYNLPTLKEVETHIAVKGHLKDIPSAKEVAKNGIFLGDMNAKLLQKIEELTLYTIAQEKKITAQQKAINQLESLKKRFDQLEKLIKDK
jgi:hypothetical protein